MNHVRLELIVLSFSDIARQIRVADVFDVLGFALLIYAMLTCLRERASYAVVVAFLAAGAIYVAARYFEMYLTLQVFRVGLPVLLIILVVVFQDDLRRAVERFFGWRPWVKRRGNLATEVIDVIIESVAYMVEQGVGALIVLRGREPLELHCRGGILLDGRISDPLLRSIFNVTTPGHDGAIIISGARIERFAVHLPLSANRDMIGVAGTRHAAGLGLAERCDALVIIVSEERGTVSVAHERSLSELEGAADLRGLIAEFREETGIRKRKRPFRWATSRLGLKLASLAVASLLWLSWVYRTDSVQQSFDGIPVLIRNLPAGWEVVTVEPEQVRIRITGAERDFDFLSKESLVVTLDLSHPVQGTHALEVSDDRLSLPTGLSLSQSEPEQIWVNLARVTHMDLPIRIQTRGGLPDGYHIRKLAVHPAKLKVIVPTDQRGSVRDAPVVVDLDRADLTSQPARIRAPVSLPIGVRRQPNESETVEVIIHWEQEPVNSKPPNEPAAPKPVSSLSRLD